MSEQQNVDASEINKFSELASKWWDKQGDLKTLHDINPLRVSYVQKKVADLSGLKVADIGCGGGILSESLAKLGADVTAIDLSADAIKVAKQHAADNHLNINYRVISVEDFAKEAAGEFDVVTCMELLEHVPFPDKLIANCTELMRPKGHFFCSTLNRNWKSFMQAIVFAEYLLKILPRRTHEYAKFIKPSELSAWARISGLTVVDLVGIQYDPWARTAQFVPDLAANYLMHAQVT